MSIRIDAHDDGDNLDGKAMDASGILEKYASEYDPHSFVFREGDSARYLYFVRSGKIALRKRVGSTDQTLGIVGPGEVFGEIALIGQGMRLSSAQALETSQVLALDESIVIELMSTSGDFMLTVIKALVKRIVQLSDLAGSLDLQNKGQ